MKAQSKTQQTKQSTADDTIRIPCCSGALTMLEMAWKSLPTAQIPASNSAISRGHLQIEVEREKRRQKPTMGASERSSSIETTL